MHTKNRYIDLQSNCIKFTIKNCISILTFFFPQESVCPYVVNFITCGRHGDYNYMVMELLGDNLSEYRRRQPNNKFSLLTSMKLAIQMTKAIEAVHDLGYLHRDIKPVKKNFLLFFFP